MKKKTKKKKTLVNNLEQTSLKVRLTQIPLLTSTYAPGQ